MRGIDGRSQGDDEHVRERIPWMRDRARTGDDAGFSADGARPSRPAKMQGLSDAGH